jgi:hypothetical protein
MRIDEIDLYGNLLISGSTGSEGQILTYGNDGGFAWGTASGGSSGPTSSYFKTSGYNYVICETVNNGVDPAADAVINGTNLINAYNLAKTLDVGGLSATNRVVVLLMPGDYDLSSSQFQLDTSFIDLVGISSNPYDTILRSSTQFATLQYTIAVDSALKNVHLKQGTNLSVSDAEGAGDGSYLRWENVIVSGNCFADSTNLFSATCGFSNIYGEFQYIIILSSAIFVVTTGVVDGIFNNIFSENILTGFIVSTSNITGTFSNFDISGCNESCFSSSAGYITGTFENISIKNSGYIGILSAFSDININLKNFYVDGTIAGVFSSNNIFGNYENIYIASDSSSIFNVTGDMNISLKNLEVTSSLSQLLVSGTMSGTYENITAQNISSNFMYSGVGDITGTFKNIEVGNLSYGFYSQNNIDGTFEDIKTGNVDFFFSSAGSYIQGTYSNIESGDVNTAFYTTGTVSGYFSDIKLGNSAGSAGCFKGDSGLVGYFENIEVGDMPNMNVFHSNGGVVTGIFKNIKLGESSICFQSESSNLLGTFENIEFGLASYAAFNSLGGNIDGTFNNIKTNYPTSLFMFGLNNLTGTFSNIEVPQIDSVCFLSNQLSGSFKNIKIGDLSGIDQHTFYSGTDLTGTFENIEVGDGNASYDIFKSNGGNIIGTFSNIKIGDNYPQAFYALGSISGSYKDITIGNLGSGRIFYGSGISIGTTIDNLYSITRMHSTPLNGRLINSTIIDSVNGWYLVMDSSAIVENCKLITNGGSSISPYGSVNYNVQVLYTATNEGFDNSGGDQDLMTPNYNITDAGLT